MDFLRRVLYWWTIGWSFISLWAERLWARFWALCTVLMFFGAFAVSGLIFKFGKTGHFVLLIAFLGLAILAAFYMGRRFILPRRWQIERRIESESGLKHRPLAMMHDKPEQGASPAAIKLWYKQRAEAQKAWGALRVWRPRPRVGRQDRYNLRFTAMICLALALLFAQGRALDRLEAALRPPALFKMPVTTVAMDVWIEPPAYTTAAPVFLATAQTGRTTAEAASVPDGSILKLRIGGLKRAPKLFYDGKKTLLFEEAAPGSFTLEMPLSKSGVMEIRRGWWQSPLGSWNIDIIPDRQPDVQILSADAAERAALKITYSARDDYGIRSLRAVIEPSPDIPAEPWHETITFDIPFSGRQSREAEFHVEHLAHHPMAGTPVMIKLVATDDTGHAAESNIEKIVLPERQFKNPAAIAVNRERKRLIRFDDPLTFRLTSAVLVSLANRPGVIKEDLRVFLGLVVSVKRLGYTPTKYSAFTVRDILWNIALRLEDGGLVLAREELRQALQKLNQALNDKNISEEKLQELSEDVNKKTQQYMQELAKEMRQRMEQGDGEQQKQPEISPELAQKLMDKMDMSDIEEMIRQMQHGDSREQMQAMTEMMQKMLDSTDPGNAMGEREQKALEQLQKMEDLIQDQQKLIDQTGKKEPKQESGEEAGEQGRIRQELGDVMRGMGENMPEVPEQFGSADQEMKDAQQQLGRGEPGKSLPHQKEALKQLQEGQDQALQQMADQMKAGMSGSGSGGTGQSSNNYGEGYDPLGRNHGKHQPFSDVKIPDEKERRRVQEIIQELRGRSNDWERPREERQYIDRLLDPFSN
ncbi:MAG: DUF4175 domain-containing protein [Alphaproteobacteria bacterium]